MAKSRSKKAEDRKVRASRLTAKQFKSFIGSVGELRQDLDDASMAHAAEFKKADSLGIHKAASALVMKLDKMEPAKRADFLRSFDTYRDWMEEWDAQPDLLEDEDESTGEEGEGEDGGEGGPAAINEPVSRAEPEAPIQVDADHGEDAAAASPVENLDDVGYIFATGKAAGLAGEDLEAGAPDQKTQPAAYNSYTRGHALGVQQRLNPPPAEDEAAPKKGARRRKKADEGAPLLH